MMATVERFCLCCNKKILGRSDKKFCDDGCRNQYNNARNQENSKVVKQVNQILAKNRRILIQFLGTDEKLNTNMEKLKSHQFNPKYITHQYTTQKGVTYNFIYEYGFLPLDNDRVLIVKRDPHD